VELIAGILRLGKKYDIPLFRKDCLRRLKMEFYTTLEEYEQSSDWTHIKEEDNMLIPLVSLAREIGLYSVLPQMYYCIVAHHESHYMPKVGNNLLFLMPASMLIFQVLGDQEPGLNVVDQLACMRGYIKLLELQSRGPMAWLKEAYIPAKSCHQRRECSLALEEIIKDISRPHRPDIIALDGWHDEWDDGLCNACKMEAQKVFEDGRNMCWNELPSVFGLPGWEELKSLDFE
jgi:hypothetical protein